MAGSRKISRWRALGTFTGLLLIVALSLFLAVGFLVRQLPADPWSQWVQQQRIFGPWISWIAGQEEGGPETEFYAWRPAAVYEEATIASPLVEWLQTGETVPVLENRGQWIQVQGTRGVGWVNRVPITPAAPRPTKTPLPPEMIPETFQAASGVTVREGFPPSRPSSLGTAGPEELAAAHRTAKRDWVHQLRQENQALEWAQSHLTDKRMQRLDSKNFSIWTDHKDRSRSGFVLGLAEATRRRFQEIFSPRFELLELEGQSWILLFHQRSDYQQFYSLFPEARAINPSGHYTLDLRTIALFEHRAPGTSTASTLIHEMTHLLLDQSLLGETHRISPWLNEGIACALAYSLGSSDGEIAQVQTSQDPFRIGTTAQHRWDSFQRVLASGASISLPELLEVPETVFQSEQGIRWYDQAWLWCHFLLFEEAQRHRSVLFDFLAAEVEGKQPSQETLKELLALEPQWRQFLRRPRR